MLTSSSGTYGFFEKFFCLNFRIKWPWSCRNARPKLHRLVKQNKTKKSRHPLPRRCSSDRLAASEQTGGFLVYKKKGKTNLFPPSPLENFYQTKWQIVFSEYDFFFLKVQHKKNKKTPKGYSSMSSRHCKSLNMETTWRGKKNKQTKKRHQTKLHDSHSHLFKILFTSLNSFYNQISPFLCTVANSPKLLSKLVTGNCRYSIIIITTLLQYRIVSNGCMALVLSGAPSFFWQQSLTVYLPLLRRLLR